MSPTEEHLESGHSVRDILTLSPTMEPTPWGDSQLLPWVVGLFLSLDT